MKKQNGHRKLDAVKALTGHAIPIAQTAVEEHGQIVGILSEQSAQSIMELLWEARA